MRQFILKIVEPFRVNLEVEKFVHFASNVNIFTQHIGLARSFLALGTLSILLFNSMSALFPEFLFTSKVEVDWYRSYSLFFLLSNYLLVAKGISISILIISITGFYPRFFGVLHWYIAYSFFVTSPLIDGGDQISTILTLLLVPITLLDSRKNHFISSKKRLSPHLNLILVSFLFLIKLQVAILYFHSAVAKFEVDEWVNGTALYYWLLHPIHGASDWLAYIIRPVLENKFLITFFTWGVLIFELVLSCTIFVSVKKIKYRKRMLIMGVLFHFSIFLVHGLPSFFCAMTGALLIFCLPIGSEAKIFNKW